MESKVDIMDLIKDDFIPKIAEDIATACQDNASIKNTDCSFSVSAGKMDGDKNTNTTIFFDIDPKYTHFYQYKKASFDRELTEQEILATNEFIKKVSEYITLNFIEKIRNAARKGSIPDSNTIIFPLKEIIIKNIDICDLDGVEEFAKCKLKVGKLIKKSSFATQGDGVAVELIEIHKETGKDVNEIIKEKKAQGISKYDNVTHAVWEKYNFEFFISLYVDYSPEDQDMLLKGKK